MARKPREIDDSPPDESPPAGLRCPRCGCSHFYTVTTEPLVGRIRRYKECRHCRKRIRTKETLDTGTETT